MRSERGFTLVEVLVIIFLLGLGMLAFLQVTVISARMQRQSRSISTALLLAQGRMEFLEAVGWKKAVEELPRSSLPALMGTTAEYYHEAVDVSGRSYLLVLERVAGQQSPDLVCVHCFWEGDGSGFVRKNSLRLATKRCKFP